MGLLDVASGKSLCRGYGYCKEKRVTNIVKNKDNTFDAIVNGTQEYLVHVDKDHPRKSTCNCPYANGRKVICKHIVAAYFTMYPNEVKNYEYQQEEDEKEYEEYVKKESYALKKYLNKCKKEKLIEHVYELLNQGPDWIYDRFIRDNVDVE